MAAVSKVGLKMKVLAILLIPLVGLLCFGLVGVYGRLSDFRQMKALEGLISFSVKASSVVHECLL